MKIARIDWSIVCPESGRLPTGPIASGAHMNKHMTSLAILLLCCVSRFVSSAEMDLIAHFDKILKPLLPDVKVTQVKPAPIADLYEVMMGTAVLYVTLDGAYALRGDLVDLKNRRNLTDAAQDQVRRDAIAGVDPATMISFVPERETKLDLYVFTDIDCSYCRKLHTEMSELLAHGIAVHYLAFPREGLESDAYRKAVAVWCSADRQKAITAAKAGMTVTAASCRDPVTEHFALGNQIGVSATPTVILKNGRYIGGYMPADELVARYIKD
ncbi:MAG: DsbC family protein [Gammaproteobacteria bacterium]|nr:DsbC family protein [Gammaproteobacteria bacterium]